MPLVGKDWTQSGVARLFSAIKVCICYPYLFPFFYLIDLEFDGRSRVDEFNVYRTHKGFFFKEHLLE